MSKKRQRIDDLEEDESGPMPKKSKPEFEEVDAIGANILADSLELKSVGEEKSEEKQASVEDPEVASLTLAPTTGSKKLAELAAIDRKLAKKEKKRRIAALRKQRMTDFSSLQQRGYQTPDLGTFGNSAKEEDAKVRAEEEKKIEAEKEEEALAAKEVTRARALVSQFSWQEMYEPTVKKKWTPKEIDPTKKAFPSAPVTWFNNPYTEPKPGPSKWIAKKEEAKSMVAKVKAENPRPRNTRDTKLYNMEKSLGLRTRRAKGEPKDYKSEMLLDDLKKCNAGRGN